LKKHLGSRTRQQTARMVTRESARLMERVSESDQPRAREAVQRHLQEKLGRWYGMPRLDGRYGRSTHERVRDEDLLSDEPLLMIGGRRVQARKYRTTGRHYTPEWIEQERAHYAALRATVAEAKAHRSPRR
jgi:hypothetical protein